MNIDEKIQVVRKQQDSAIANLDRTADIINEQSIEEIARLEAQRDEEDMWIVGCGGSTWPDVSKDTARCLDLKALLLNEEGQIATLQARNKELEDENKSLSDWFVAYQYIEDNSTGVVGYHLNDNIARWSEFEFPAEYPRELLPQQENV